MVSKADTDLCAGDHYGTPGNNFHTEPMKTLNSEPRIEINWTPGAWAGYAYAAPTLKAADFNLAMAMAELASVAAERDKLKAELDTARQSLRAAEQDVDETESANSDLRTVNARLMADLAAAMEWAARTPRLNHAESILMQ